MLPPPELQGAQSTMHCFSFRFHRASQKQCIVDCAPCNSGGGSIPHSCAILLGRQGHDRESLVDILEKQQHLVAAQSKLSWQPSRSCIQFSQTVACATALLFVSFQESSEASFVVLVVYKKAGQ